MTTIQKPFPDHMLCPHTRHILKRYNINTPAELQNFLDLHGKNIFHINGMGAHTYAEFYTILNPNPCDDILRKSIYELGLDVPMYLPFVGVGDFVMRTRLDLEDAGICKPLIDRIENILLKHNLALKKMIFSTEYDQLQAQALMYRERIAAYKKKLKIITDKMHQYSQPR